MLQVSSCFVYRFKLLLPERGRWRGSEGGGRELGTSARPQVLSNRMLWLCRDSEQAGWALAGAGEQEAPREFRNQGGFELQA